MPTPKPLDLTPDCKVKPQAWHRAAIESAMIFPDDERQRDRDRLSNLLNLDYVLSQDPELYSKEYYIETARVAHRTPCWDDVMPDWEERCWQGLVAGLFAMYAIQASKTEEGPIVYKEIRQFVSDRFRTPQLKHLRIRLNQHTIENTVWPRMKRAGHLWAAKCWFHFLSNPDQVRTDLEWFRPFPVPLSELDRFVGIAEFFRREGEKIKPVRGEQLFTPGETIVPPADVEITERDVVFFRETPD